MRSKSYMALFIAVVVAASLLIFPDALFAQGAGWEDYDKALGEAIDVAKKASKGVGEIFFGVAPVFILGGVFVWSFLEARKKAQREDKDTKVMPFVIAIGASLLAFALLLFVFIGLDMLGVPAWDKARAFWQ